MRPNLRRGEQRRAFVRIPVAISFVCSMLLGGFWGAGIARSQAVVPAPGVRSNTLAGMPAHINVGNTKLGNTDGLIAKIHPPQPSSPGYQDWTVEVQRADGRAFDYDRELVIQITFGYSDGSRTQQPIFLKQGSLNAVQSFQAACWCHPYYWQCKFYVNGRELKGLRNSNSIQTFGNNYQGGTDQTMLLVFRDDDDGAEEYLEEYEGQLTSLLYEYRGCRQWQAPKRTTTAQTTSVVGNNDIAMHSRLPTNWLSLSRYTSIIITRDALEQISDQQVDAMKKYLMGGGTIHVTRCTLVDSPKKNGFEETESIVRKLNLQSSVQESTENENSLPIRFVETNSQYQAVIGFGILELSATKEIGKLPKPVPTGLGAALPVPQFTVPNPKVPVIARPTGQWPNTFERTSWSTMRGTTYGAAAGNNFWNWLIPNVGRPPVWAFAFFIILFAGVAGPAIAYFTIRARRPAWLIILFPLVAFVVTSTLAVYAIFHDGFQSISRVRSVTWYNLAQDEGFAWSRQTIFSGSPPREGLLFSLNSEITPMNWNDTFSPGRGANSVQRWQPEHQSFSGLLPHREQRQFLVRHPVQGLRPLALEKSGESWMIENRTQENFPFALCCDEGKYFLACDIGPNKKATMEVVNPNDGILQLQKLVEKQEVQLPEGLVQGQQVSVIDWMNSRSSLSNWNVNEPLMERMLVEQFDLTKVPQNRTFAVVMELGGHLDRPLKSTESDSIHVMVGSW